MTWFDIDGQLYEEFGASEKALVAAGGRGWATQAQAQAHSQPTNPALKLATLDLAVFHTVANPGAVASNAATNALKNAIGTPPKGWENWLQRIGYVVFGIVLVAVGVSKITDKVPAATAIAKAVK